MFALLAVLLLADPDADQLERFKAFSAEHREELMQELTSRIKGESSSPQTKQRAETLRQLRAAMIRMQRKQAAYAPQFNLGKYKPGAFFTMRMGDSVRVIRGGDRQTALTQTVTHAWEVADIRGPNEMVITSVGVSAGGAERDGMPFLIIGHDTNGLTRSVAVQLDGVFEYVGTKTVEGESVRTFRKAPAVDKHLAELLGGSATKGKSGKK